MKVKNFLRRLLFVFINTLLIPLEIYLKKKKIIIIGRDGSALGDHLVMTSVINFFEKEYKFKFLVFTTHPSFFENNPNIIKLYDRKSLNKFLRFFVDIIFTFSNRENIIFFRFRDFKNNEKYEDYMRRTQLELHLAKVNMKHTKYYDKLKNYDLNCKIYFSKQEIKAFEKKYSFLPNKYIIVQPQAKTSFSKVKDWGFNNFQKIILDLNDLNWIQCGVKSDKKLKGNIIDLRGIPLREFFYVISKANLILSTEGFFTHTSSAFNIKNITIFSGLLPIKLSKYRNIIPIAISPQMKCAYCWTLGNCPLYKEAKCIKDIRVSDVKKIIKKEFNF